uniref:C2H2-type domain-containing protein n=1 Tax=Neogobius melanostomus TaxID=47308 RepID=A0A8C6UMA5_9GOBI
MADRITVCSNKCTFLPPAVVPSEDLLDSGMTGHPPLGSALSRLDPPPRLADPPSPEQDMLTCGQCQATFPLADIILFIDHKRRRCHGPPCLSAGGRGLDKPPSPSPGLALTPSPALRGGRRPVEVGVQATLAEAHEDKMVSPRGICPKLEPLPGKHARTHILAPLPLWGPPYFTQMWVHPVQGCKEEPTTYTCTTCKQPYGSAWFLLQHAQNSHGFRIYLDSEHGSPLTPRMGGPPSLGGGADCPSQPDRPLSTEIKSE